MTTESFVQPAIPRFEGHYNHWSMLMENFLRSKEYWQVVSEGFTEAAAGTVLTDVHKSDLESQWLKDLKVNNDFFQAIDRPILETILFKDTSKQIWDSMKRKFQGSMRAKRQQLQSLRQEFELLRMKSGETISDFFSRTMAIVNKMRVHSEKMEDVTVVEKILHSQTPKFNYVVCSIEESKYIDLLLIDELQGSLLVHEQKLNQQDKEEQALLVSFNNHRKGDRGRGKSRGRGHGGYRSITDNSKSVDKSNVECYRCYRYGHYQNKCRTNLSKDNGEKSNFTETQEQISLLMVCNTKEESNKHLWYMDTGCSNHMCGDKEISAALDESYRDNVKFGNHTKISVMGKGQVTIRIKENNYQTISSVVFVPDLKTNLLSIGQLQEKGYEIKIKNGVCRILDDKVGLIAQAKMTANRMFLLYLDSFAQMCFSTRLKDESWLWHFRYGHMNFNGLKTLQHKKMVASLPTFSPPTEICERCVVSKQHRDPFPKGKTRRTRKLLEIVHSDL
ncbi:uncharacterized protein LOC107262284 [Ricinus communis]|uniref:uncharacterized protein LOC107262284 n=1 Tax=Ricinus communis TaxID=3988 RepID=UPI000772D212|nr:uncharacterized protein LOC107262284 [Ricinus communis]|eukprot:XP_015582688.1 uncharacterized protein LOC107262284 [Ricinus communis]